MSILNSKKLVVLFSTFLVAFTLFAPVTNASSMIDLNDENVTELSKKESKNALSNNSVLKEKINDLKKKGYKVDENTVYEYEKGHYFISFEKDNVKGLVELTWGFVTVFYAELNSNLEVQKLTVENPSGKVATVDYDQAGNPILPDQSLLSDNSNNVLRAGNVCDWGILSVGTVAGAGYGAVFGGLVGAGVGAGIGALGIIYC